ncbi:MAG: hypothetical protein SCH68_10815 [Brevefilum sp.]|nr:hypothetical protein [Brevefilum sp.]
MGLIARGLELAGIPTTLTSWQAGIIRRAAPPRFTITNLKGGMTLGNPGDKAQQERILDATLALLEKDAPIEPLYLKEN